MVAHLLFDLDGTLTDSRPGIIACIRAVLRDLGHEPDAAVDLTHAIGPPLQDVMADVLSHYRDHRVAEAVAAYREHYRAFGRFDNAVYDGIEELLAAARAYGMRLYVATSKQSELAREVLAHLHLDHLFDAIYGAEAGGALDRKPALVAHILAREAITPRDAMMVGDRHHDIEGAHANDMRAIGAVWGYGGRVELASAGADMLAESPGDLADILGLRHGHRMREAIR